jgi:predicted HAD superfamily hydrolase
MTFPALSDVLATCREQRITSFSFDIFDTFLFRRCTTPDGVFDSAYDFAPLGDLATGWRDTFRARRREAEFSARTTLSDQSKGKEVTIEQIYQRFPVAPFGLSDTHRPALVEAEFQAEKALCFVNDQALALYRALRAEGIKTGFISDIYWSEEQISTLPARPRVGFPLYLIGLWQREKPRPATPQPARPGRKSRTGGPYWR